MRIIIRHAVWHITYTILNGRHGCFVRNNTIWCITIQNPSQALWVIFGASTLDPQNQKYVQAIRCQYHRQWLLSNNYYCWYTGRQFPKRGRFMVVLFRPYYPTAICDDRSGGWHCIDVIYIKRIGI